jgi:hypothetical protein
MVIRASAAVLAGFLLHAAWPGSAIAQGSSSAADSAAAALTPPAVVPASTPPDFPRGRISGYMFGDAYYNADGDPTHVYSAGGADAGQPNIDGVKNITKDLNGAQFRRIYFQLDNDLSVRLATRFRLEVDGRNTTTADGRLGVFVKNAYLQAKSVVPRGDVFFGMLSTPTFENSEEFWQYRSIEKTIADFRGVASSSDLGLELKGFLDGAHRIGYSAMVGDGTGQRPEADRFKRWYLSLPLRFGDLRIEPYADYQPVRVTPNLAAPAEPESVAVANDQATWKIFAGYELRRLALGVEAFDRVLHRAGVNNVEPRGLSMFARGTLAPTLNAFARADLYQPDVNATKRVDSWLWMAGVDWTPFRDGAWQPLKDVHVMPNVEAVRYQSKGAAVAPAHGDLQARLTLYYRFSRPQS